MSRGISFTRTVVSICLGLWSHIAVAGPLTRAEVTKVINQVSVVDPRAGVRAAAVHDVVKDDLGLQTGVKSRSELLFQDNTLTRLGAETFFSFKTGTRDLTLERGSMLLQVPKGLGGAKIHTAAVTAAITGTTIMMEYIPAKYIKVLVLEGSLRLSRNGVLGDSVLLTAGKMVIMHPDAKSVPDPVDVDLRHVVRTSKLVNFPGAAPLPSTSLIQAAIEEQQQQLATMNLVPTNLVIAKGTNVIVATNNQLAQFGLLTRVPATSPKTTLNNSVLPGVNSAATSATSSVEATVGNAAPGLIAANLPETANGLVASVPASSTNQVPATANGLVASVPVSSTNQVPATASGLVASVPVSSTNQIGSLLQTAVQTLVTTVGGPHGLVAIVPTVINPTTIGAAVTGTVPPLSLIPGNPAAPGSPNGGNGAQPAATPIPKGPPHHP